MDKSGVIIVDRDKNGYITIVDQEVIFIYWFDKIKIKFLGEYNSPEIYSRSSFTLSEKE